MFAEPFALDDDEVFLQTSIGIAIARLGTETAEELIRDADAAMYRAKDAGKGRFEIFDDQMRADVVARLHTESALRRALERGELRLHYQPEIDVIAHRVDRLRGAGALAAPDARPAGAQGVHPAGRGDRADRADRRLGAARGVRRRGALAGGLPAMTPLTLSVNLSARQFHQPDLVASVRAVLEDTGHRPGEPCAWRSPRAR